MKAKLLTVLMVLTFGVSAYSAPQDNNKNTASAEKTTTIKEIRPSELPSSVKDAFLNEYPDAKVQTITYDGHAYRFDYEDADGMEASVAYDSNREKIGEIRYNFLATK